MLLYVTLVTTTLACTATHPDGLNKMIADMTAIGSEVKGAVKGADFKGSEIYGLSFNDLGRSGNDNTLSNKWQREKDLKAEMMSGITHCLTTRSRPMEKSKQRALEKTEWFTAWDTHCSNQIDLNCPIKAGECWAMGVITCRKNCDAKFLLRGNRGKFKRCIYKQMKGYEKDNVGVVSEQCSVFSANNSLH